MVEIAISFQDIYTRAVALFDDPKITYAYETNKIRFNKTMWPFLQNAISAFAQPTMIAFWNADYTEPSGTMEIFIEETDTTTSELMTTFELDADFEIIEGSIYQYTADGESVIGYLNTTDRTVTFPETIEEGAEFSIEQYFPGCFNQDSIDVLPVSQASVLRQVEGILAHRLVLTWAEGERNYLLDIRNLMADADFKKTAANAKSLTSKDAWVDRLHTEVYTMETQLGWMIRFAKSANWGK